MSKTTTIYAAKAVTLDPTTSTFQISTNVRIHIQDTTITSITHSPHPHATDIHTPLALPGMIDIHTHGLNADPAIDAAETWCLDPEPSLRTLAASGVTSILASLTFPESTTEAVTLRLASTSQTLAPYASTSPPRGCARVLGIHAEGPVVADPGGLPVPGDEVVDSDGLERAVAAAEEEGVRVAVMTISPSADEASGFARIRSLARMGVVPSLGHDRSAPLDETVVPALVACAEQGIRPHVTHGFNVQSFHHRKPSLANLALASSFPSSPPYTAYLDTGVAYPSVEVIGDGVHIHPFLLHTMVSIKPPGSLAFISDSILCPLTPSDSTTPTHRYCGRAIESCPSLGAVILSKDDDDSEAAPVIAGSCATLLTTLRLLHLDMGVDLPTASFLCSAAPAQVLQQPDLYVGAIAPGFSADLLLISSPSTLSIQDVFIAGRSIHHPSSPSSPSAVNTHTTLWPRSDGLAV